MAAGVFMRIGLIVFPGCVASGLFAFAELLEIANKRSGKKTFELVWAGVDNTLVPVTVGSERTVVSLTPEITIDDPSLDSLLLPGFWSDGEKSIDKAMLSLTILLDMLRDIPESTTIWGYCTSVSLLAEVGRLNYKEATSTWWLADFLQNKYSDVHWRFSQTCILLETSGTASGLNGYLPIAQALISKMCGNDVHRDIVDLMVLPKPETITEPLQSINLMHLDDTLIRQIFVWVEQTPSTQLTISGLANALSQSERTLSRKVKTATSFSCAHFMRLIKMHQASEYLIYTSDSINVISDRLGFSDDAAFRRTFKKVSHYSPGEYRQRFKR